MASFLQLHNPGIDSVDYTIKDKLQQIRIPNHKVSDFGFIS